MRDLFIQFRKSEDGASLVEYAVALIVVTIVGGAGVLLIGNDSGDLARCAADTVGDAVAEVAKTSVGNPVANTASC